MFQLSKVTRRFASSTPRLRKALSESSRRRLPSKPSHRSQHHLVSASSVGGSIFASVNPSFDNIGGQGGLHRQQVRTVFIQTENTPNPESIKFVPSGRVVLENEDGNGYFVQKSDPTQDILKSPLATQLFKVDGVKAIYLGSDFVTVTKFAQSPWYVPVALVPRAIL